MGLFLLFFFIAMVPTLKLASIHSIYGFEQVTIQRYRSHRALSISSITWRN